MKVGDAMHKAVVIKKNISLREAAGMMSDNKIGSLIYVEDDKPIGIITESDLVREFGKGESVKDIMSKRVVSVEASANLQKALELMNRHKIKRLPVIDKEKIVGVITATDLLANENELEGDFLFD